MQTHLMAGLWIALGYLVARIIAKNFLGTTT